MYLRVCWECCRGVLSLLERLNHCKLCTGNNDEKFLELAAWRQGEFMDKSGNIYYIAIEYFSAIGDQLIGNYFRQ